MDVKELMKIIAKNDSLKLREALKNSIDYNHDYRENHLVFYACQEKAQNSALELIKNGKPFSESPYNMTPLMLACWNGQKKVVDKILSLKPKELHRKNFTKMTPFMYAVLSGDLTLVDSLVERGADVHALDSSNCNILYYTNRLNFEMTDYLLEKGVDPNYKEKITPVKKAILDDKKEILKAYLKHYDKLNDKNKELIKKERVRILFS